MGDDTSLNLTHLRYQYKNPSKFLCEFKRERYMKKVVARGRVMVWKLYIDTIIKVRPYGQTI